MSGVLSHTKIFKLFIQNRFFVQNEANFANKCNNFTVNTNFKLRVF